MNIFDLLCYFNLVICILLLSVTSVKETCLAVLAITNIIVFVVGFMCRSTLQVEQIGFGLHSNLSLQTLTGLGHIISGRARGSPIYVGLQRTGHGCKNGGNFKRDLRRCSESYLHDSCQDCGKNPKHEEFISVNEFTTEILPPEFRDPAIVAFIQALADVTVRVNVKFTSTNRTENDCFYQNRGTECLRTGSGWIGIGEIDDESNSHIYSDPCPCEKCSTSGNPKKEWRLVEIWTASHLVMDNSEARKTEIHVILNDKLYKLYGVEVNYMCREGDRCSLYCVTHSIKVRDKLRNLSRQRRDAGNSVPSKFSGTKLAVHVSFPHGYEKTISYGEWVNRNKVSYKSDTTSKKHKDKERTEYTYTTMTCPGCSGGPVWIVGKKHLHSTVHPHSHSCATDEGQCLGVSGVGWQ